MGKALEWLPEAAATPWESLRLALQSGLPVPNGYVVVQSTPEDEVRCAYEELRIKEKTHFLAVRGASHAVLNVIGPDVLMHALRRFWAESPDSAVLVQRMVHAIWCGKTQRQQEDLRVTVNEGMMILDPDVYLFSSTGTLIGETVQPKQRKMIRYVDGTPRVVTREGARTPMPADDLERVVELSMQAGRDIGWAIDDLGKLWVVSAA